MDERGRDVRPSAEYAGKSVDEALKRAAAELGVAPEDLEYEVIRDTSRSVFGLVRTGEAAIRVWLPRSPEAYEEPEEGLAAVEEAAFLEDAPSEEAFSEEEDDDREDVAEAPEGDTVRAGGSARAASKASELERVAFDVLSTLLDKMGVMGAVEVSSRGGEVDAVTGETSPVILNVVGDDLGILIGRRGDTLRDLQFVTRLIVSRKIGSWPNVVVDVENYKAKRAVGLQTLAQRLADQVRTTGRSAVMEPMPAHERRIIHLALRDDPDVYTESAGEDEDRKVQILPK